MKFWTGSKDERKARVMKWVIALAVVLPFGSAVLVGLGLYQWWTRPLSGGTQLVTHWVELPVFSRR